jgi:hypothetical protein
MQNQLVNSTICKISLKLAINNGLDWGERRYSEIKHLLNSPQGLDALLAAKKYSRENSLIKKNNIANSTAKLGISEVLYAIILNNNYKFSKVNTFTVKQKTYTSWNWLDGLINKIVSNYISITTGGLLSKNCYTLKNHGGCSLAARLSSEYSKRYKYVYRTDVNSYYTNINHRNILCYFTKNYKRGVSNPITRLVWHSMRHVQYDGRRIIKIKKGLCRGGSLAPLLGGIYLQRLDKHFEANSNYQDIKYLRVMDDILVFANKKHEITKAKQDIESIIHKLGMKLRPEKTSFGLVEQGFWFVGFTFNNTGVTGLAPSTHDNFIKKAKPVETTKLIFKSPNNTQINNQYVKNFLSWVRGNGAEIYSKVLKVVNTSLDKLKGKVDLFCNIKNLLKNYLKQIQTNIKNKVTTRLNIKSNKNIQRYLLSRADTNRLIVISYKAVVINYLRILTLLYRKKYYVKPINHQKYSAILLNKLITMTTNISGGANLTR